MFGSLDLWFVPLYIIINIIIPAPAALSRMHLWIIYVAIVRYPFFAVAIIGRTWRFRGTTSRRV